MSRTWKLISTPRSSENMFPNQKALKKNRGIYLVQNNRSDMQSVKIFIKSLFQSDEGGFDQPDYCQT